MGIREHVREVFLAPQAVYEVSEAAELLGWSMAEIRAAIANGELEATVMGAGQRIVWREVAAMMTAQYPQAMIEEALGLEAQAVMPELVRLSELRVAIPRYEVVMLGRLAEREQITIDEFLSRHLLDLAGAESEWLAAAIPEFSEAMRWPER
jgi:excisionase family DNA binding protein